MSNEQVVLVGAISCGFFINLGIMWSIVTIGTSLLDCGSPSIRRRTNMDKGQTIPVPNFTDRLYISGPMTGLPKHNYPAFHKTTKTLRRLGYTVYNPAENFGGAQGLLRKEYMRVDIIHLLQAQTVIFLPDWRSSIGARLEMQIANELDLTIRFLRQDLYYEG